MDKLLPDEQALYQASREEAELILEEARNNHCIAEWPGTQRIQQGIFKVALSALRSQAKFKHEFAAGELEEASQTRCREIRLRWLRVLELRGAKCAELRAQEPSQLERRPQWSNL